MDPPLPPPHVLVLAETMLSLVLPAPLLSLVYLDITELILLLQDLLPLLPFVLLALELLPMPFTLLLPVQELDLLNTLLVSKDIP